MAKMKFNSNIHDYIETVCYNKEQVDSKLADAGFKPLVVQSLPTTGQANILYLVPKSSGGGGEDIHEEYIWIPNLSKYEHIGNATVDLSNYYTKSETDTKLDGKASTSVATQSANGLMSKTDKAKLDGITISNYYTKSETDGKLDGKASKDTATTTTNGLMSAYDKTKVDSVATGATKTVVDSSLSATSTNPVQNKAIYTSLANKANKDLATHTVDGLMSSSDKGKLDGVSVGATKTQYTQNTTSGEKIGTITINNTPTDLYAPSGSGGGSVLTVPNGAFVSVNGSDDDGDGSLGKPYATLSKALSTITSGGVVYFLPGTYTNVLDVTITKSCTLEGVGEVVLDAQEQKRHLKYNSVGVLTVKGLQFANGKRSGDGGAIYAVSVNNSGLVVVDCTFTNNTADNGGAIWSNSALTVSDCTFTNNTATNNGGAIWSNSALTVSDCTFTNNTADYGGGAILGSSSTSALTVSDCTFTNNTADYGGGAIYGGSVVVSDSEFKNEASFTGKIIIAQGSKLSLYQSIINATGSTTPLNYGTLVSKGNVINDHLTDTVALVFTKNDGSTVTYNIAKD